MTNNCFSQSIALDPKVLESTRPHWDRIDRRLIPEKEGDLLHYATLNASDNDPLTPIMRLVARSVLDLPDWKLLAWHYTESYATEPEAAQRGPESLFARMLVESDCERFMEEYAAVFRSLKNRKTLDTKWGDFNYNLQKLFLDCHLRNPRVLVPCIFAKAYLYVGISLEKTYLLNDFCDDTVPPVKRGRPRKATAPALVRAYREFDVFQGRDRSVVPAGEFETIAANHGIGVKTLALYTNRYGEPSRAGWSILNQALRLKLKRQTSGQNDGDDMRPDCAPAVSAE